MIKVIIVDDEIKVCKLICSLVNWASLGMEIAGVAHNGRDALALVESLKPDIIITDIRMPGVDGLELIKASKNASPYSEFIIVSGYKQFEYAQSAIKYGVKDYLLKPIKKSELENTLKKLGVRKPPKLTDNNSEINRLRLSLYTEVLFGDKKMPNIEIVNNQFKYDFPKSCFQCFAVKLDFSSYSYYVNTINLLNEKTVSTLEGLLKGECYDIAFATNESIIYCIVNYEDSKKADIRKKIRQAMEELNTLKSLFDVQFTIGLDAAKDKLYADSLEKTERLVKQRLLGSAGKIIEELPEEIGFEQSLLNSYDEAIEKAAELLDLNKVLEASAKLKASALQSIKTGYIMFELVESAYGIYISKLNKFHGLAADLDNIPSEFQLCGSATAIFEKLDEYLNKILIEFIENKKQEDARPIRLAKQYIYNNYMKPLTLEEVSGVVGFNPSYFSSLFKKETEENFLVYLTKVRIDKAKELLRDTNFTIADICSRVGYSDIRHFTSYFKKYAGIKPNEYRKLYS